MSTRAVSSLTATVRADWAARWASRGLLLPSLGVDTAAGWLARARACAGPEQDALLAALLDATDGGEQAAERVLLQLLIPPTDRAVTSTGLLSQYNPGDRPGLVVTAAWEAIRLARLGPNPRFVYLTLLRDATARLAPSAPAGQRRLAAETETADPLVLIDLAGVAPPPVVPPEIRLERLLRTAVRSRIVMPEEVELLKLVLLNGRTASDVAADTGVPAATIRKRVQRITERLRQSAQAGDL